MEANYTVLSETKSKNQVPTLTRAELIEVVAKVAQVPGEHAAFIVETILHSVVQAIERGERIEIRRFGSFATRQRGARIARNPKTGTKVKVPPKKLCSSNPARNLRRYFKKFRSMKQKSHPSNGVSRRRRWTRPYGPYRSPLGRDPKRNVL